MQDAYSEISKEQFEKMIQLYNPCMDDYLYVYDLQNDYYRISEHATERFCLPGDSFEDAAAKHRQFVDANDIEMLIKEINEIKSGKKKFHDLYYRWLDRKHQSIWINCRGRVLDDENGNPHFLIGCINEIGERQKADNISGLLGESSFYDMIRDYDDNFPEGYFMRIGIDNLGDINGNLGMKYGDFVLRQVAECIQNNLGEEQRLFRIVADEFMIVDFSGAKTSDAVVLYKQIRRSIDRFIEQNKYQAVFTISAGILDTEGLYGGYDATLKLSEFTLNEAKNLGRNSYYIFEQETYDRFRRKRLITRNLHHAVNHDFQGFEIYFQPIVDAKTYRLVGAEALMRFSMPSEDEDGKMEPISPVEFIPILEQTGLIIPAGKWILREAVATCKKWQKAIPDFRINVNLSYVQVIKSNALDEILDTVRMYGIKPSSVGIEVTESGYLDSGPHFQKLWNGLKNNGIQVVLDDFGTGYSNLHCLGDLRPDYIKIDRSFTMKAIQNQYEHKLMNQIIDMAHSLNLTICIEGIEKSEELMDLRNLGADYIQGYLFGKPYSVQEFEKRFVE
ncbi:EAL domain-containing protein [Roseburia sp. MUC/MUC-530-WT-4D]|uniref:EAL domain-containing protein n=1 Tax=Roseburia porci TaxID=2605790 RepID=A0A6L5YVR5_9FIRM|nr:GGDEF and EAL domain-containing protein [Roseburia porci]MST75811.1 EAL domain-containing protein [Roseburia porci]